MKGTESPVKYISKLVDVSIPDESKVQSSKQNSQKPFSKAPQTNKVFLYNCY